MKKQTVLVKETKFFNLHEIAQGVYAAIENASKQAGSNAGFVDMGDYTIVFDSLLDIEAAADLKKVAEELTGRPLKFVVNSHFHMDHVLGNCVYDFNTNIVSSEIVRNKVLEDGKKSFDEIKGLGNNTLIEIEEGIKNAANQDEAEQLKNDYKYVANIIRHDSALRMPDVVFQGGMSFYGRQRSAKLVAFEKAHSPEDIMMYLPEEKICFTGDLLFNKMHPWIGTGIPENYLRALKELLNLDAEIFVPGHGEISSKDDIRLQIQYINELLALADKVQQAGEQEYKFTLEDISEVFRGWDGLCFSWNMDFLMKRHKVL
jgi:glyoxylase-like metal-dependent hydrolase (beta-lactamase superfamily II)